MNPPSRCGAGGGGKVGGRGRILAQHLTRFNSKNPRQFLMMNFHCPPQSTVDQLVVAVVAVVAAVAGGNQAMETIKFQQQFHQQQKMEGNSASVDQFISNEGRIFWLFFFSDVATLVSLTTKCDR